MIKRGFSSISLYPIRKGGKKEKMLEEKGEKPTQQYVKGKIQLHSSDDPFDSIKEKLNC